MIEYLPNSKISQVIGHQLLRSATSVGDNYRSACRSRSKAGFISKIRIVEEEADESVYWIELNELVKESNILGENWLSELIKEANELTTIFTAIGKTSKLNLVNPKSQNSNSQIRSNSKSEVPNPKC